MTSFNPRETVSELDRFIIGQDAAKRAVAMGYDAVKWFPGGTDEWQQASDADLVAAVPVTP